MRPTNTARMQQTFEGGFDHGVPNFPHDVMQFSGTLQLWILCHADKAEGPNSLFKYDLTNADHALMLPTMIPQSDGGTQLIAVGWANSPLTFSTTPKTATNLANAPLHCRQTCSATPETAVNLPNVPLHCRQTCSAPNSPPTFGATPKTATDLTNAQLHGRQKCSAPNLPLTFGILTPKTATNLTNVQLHCRQKCSAMLPHHLEDLASAHDSPKTAANLANVPLHCRQTCSAPSWEAFIHDMWGPSYLASTIHNIPHSASTYLQ